MVYLWNYCDDGWDVIYEHEFRVDQLDCSVATNTCGWWGPIIETFDEQLPEIEAIGFRDTLLLHDGTWSYLSPSETGFTNPPTPWTLFDLDPNRSYTAGNYTTTVATNSASNITANSAILNGTTVVNSGNATVAFEWGTTDSYGQSVTANQSPVTIVCEKTSVNATISGLIPDMTYHYRVKVTTDSETVYGDDMTFTTSPSQSIDLLSESFEDATSWGTFWTPSSGWARSTVQAAKGSYSAMVDGSVSDSTLTSGSIDLQGYSNVDISFSWWIDSYVDTGEYVAFDVDTGSGWQQIAILQGNVDPENQWNFSGPIGLSGISSLSIRFRASVSSSFEDIYVDDIQITAF